MLVGGMHMSSILEKIYDSELDLEAKMAPDTEEYRRLLGQVIALDSALRAQLPQALVPAYEAVVAARLTLTGEEVRQACLKGMKIGGKMMAELLDLHDSHVFGDDSEFEP